MAFGGVDPAVVGASQAAVVGDPVHQREKAVGAALRDEPEGELPEPLKKIAVAVECFHKASLIHDDIEDGDSKRYGQPTLHVEHGTQSRSTSGTSCSAKAID